MATIKGKTQRAQAAATAVAARGSEWVDRQDPTSRRGAGVAVARLYKSADLPLYAMLFTAYAFVTAFPATIALATLVYDNPSSFADRLEQRLRLTDQTAVLLHNVLAGASSHRLTVTLIAVGNAVLFGNGFGRTLQLVHARAWGVEVGGSKLRDQARYITVLTVFVGVVLLYLLQTAVLGRGAVAYATAPLWILIFTAFFAWAPYHLLHGDVPLRGLVPGAFLVGAGLVGLRFISTVFLSRWLNWYSENYGGFGIVLACFFWLLLFGSVVVVGAALGPPLAVRRQLLAGGDGSPTWGDAPPTRAWEGDDVTDRALHFSLDDARQIGGAIGVDWNVAAFTVEQFRAGMEVELEHGRTDATTNVTDDDPLLTGKIALAHLNEFPDYYERLAVMEDAAARRS